MKRAIFTLGVLLFAAAANGADATTYPEAEAVGFKINTANSIGAKVAAAILPVDDSTWKDVANDITGSINGGATIAQEGSTGDVNVGARYTDFDGVDDVIDMGQSYTQGVGAILENLAGEAGPASGYVLTDFPDGPDPDNGTFVSERDGGTVVFQFAIAASGDVLSFIREGVTVHELGAAKPSFGLHSFGFTLIDAANLTGYEDGAADQMVDPVGAAASSINLSIGARWDTYPAVAFQYTGKIYLVLLFNETLSGAEHASLDSNPWQVFSAGRKVDPLCGPFCGPVGW